MIARAYLGAGLLGAMLLVASCPAWSQSELNNDFRSASPEALMAEEREASALPEPMPALSPDPALVGFETSPVSRNRFWADPRSVSVSAHFVRLSVLIESPSGARSAGYYVFDCDQARDAVLATAGNEGEWHPAPRLRWQSVSGTTGRNLPHLRAVFNAVCEGGGPTRGVANMMARLRDPRTGELSH